MFPSKYSRASGWPFSGLTVRGKPPLLKLLAGLLTPTVGTVVVCGLDTGRSQIAFRRGVGYAGHRPHHYADLTVTENLAIVARDFPG